MELEHWLYVFGGAITAIYYHLNMRFNSQKRSIEYVREDLEKKYQANLKEIEKNEQAIQDLKTNVINSKFDKVFQMLTDVLARLAVLESKKK